jgi:hypothetical protein
MNRWTRALAVTLTLGVISAANHVHAEMSNAQRARAEARLIREAKALFTLVLTENLSNAANLRSLESQQVCEFDRAWDTTPTPTEIARTELGLKIHAALLATPNDIKLEDILDPDGKAGGAFCNAEEIRRGRDEQLKAFRDNQIDRVAHHYTTYTFPIFDENYQKAIVIVTGSAVGAQAHNGPRINYVYSQYAVVYTKVNGSWHHSKTIILGIT